MLQKDYKNKLSFKLVKQHKLQLMRTVKVVVVAVLQAVTCFCINLCIEISKIICIFEVLEKT